MLINQSLVRKMFKTSGQRTPTGFVSWLNLIVTATVEQAVKISIHRLGNPCLSDVRGASARTGNIIYGRHLDEAIRRLERDGLDVNSPGLAMAKAREIAKEVVNV